MRIILLLLGGIMLNGCVHQWGSLKVPEVNLATPNTAIVAEDGSFKIGSGMSYRTPFQVYCDLWGYKSATPENRIRSEYKTALRHGGRRVRVTVPNSQQPLYGVLTFCLLNDKAYGPGSRSFYIQIPESYANEATDGRISVIYELVSSRQFTDDAQYSWILWLSDAPIR